MLWFRRTKNWSLLNNCMDISIHFYSVICLIAGIQWFCRRQFLMWVSYIFYLCSSSDKMLNTIDLGQYNHISAQLSHTGISCKTTCPDKIAINYTTAPFAFRRCWSRGVPSGRFSSAIFVILSLSVLACQIVFFRLAVGLKILFDKTILQTWTNNSKQSRVFISE